MKNKVLLVALLFAVPSVLAISAPPVPGQDTENSSDQEQKETPPLPEDSTEAGSQEASGTRESSDTKKSEQQRKQDSKDSSLGFIDSLIGTLGFLF